MHEHGTVLYQCGEFCDITGLDHAAGALPYPTMTVRDLLAEKADMALGASISPEGKVLGEISVVDGKAYLTSQSGVRLMGDDELVGFTQFAQMPVAGKRTFEVSAATPEALIAQCKAHMPFQHNDLFVLKLTGKFGMVVYRGLGHEEHQPNFDALVNASKNRHVTNEAFQLSGVYHNQKPGGKCPEGLHLHGLDERTKSKGGHITDFAHFTGTVEMMPVHEWRIAAHKPVDRRFLPDCKVTEVSRFPRLKLGYEAPGTAR